jgi:competence ComEA-like helix-hairpin-helix protein
MKLFKQSDIRIIIFLSALAIIGSVLTLLKRQGKISSLDLQVFKSSSNYNYSYKKSDFTEAYPKQPQIDSLKPDTSTQIIPEPKGPLNINKIGYYDIQTLPGIGPVIAGRIIEFRDSVGIILSKEQLLDVKGIGPTKFEKIKDLIVLE